MSWWNKIIDNKALVAAVSAVGLGGIVYWAYRNYKEEQGEEEDENNNSLPSNVKPIPKVKELDIETEILKLKAEINLANPSLEDIKRILSLLASHVKSKTLNLSNKFKEERRKRFPKAKRFTNMGDYYRFSSEGLSSLQSEIMALQKEQQKLMTMIGINQSMMAKYAAQLGPFMQELVFDTNISLDQVKKSIDLKTEYLENHGQKLVEALIELAASLSLAEKQNIALFLNVVISDEVFEDDPELDREQFDMAYQRYKAEITPELIKLEKVLMPLMGQLQTALIGDQMGGYGGYGGYPGMEGDGGMGGMGMPGMGGMGGMSEQAMIQQLEQLRMQDPQAYEQLMVMMQAQMGQ